MTDTYRVATFNIHHGEGRDGRVDLERTAAVMASLDADLVALQEIDRDLSRSGHVDQPEVLRELTGYEIAFYPALAREGGEYGIALATRDGATTAAQPLPRLAREEPRLAIEASWRELSVVTTHLSREPAARVVQIDALAEAAARLSQPVLILGDLNERVERLAPLIRAGFRPAHPGSALARRLRRGFQIDHILAGPGLTFSSCMRVPTDASDHALLAATVARADAGTWVYATS